MKKKLLVILTSICLLAVSASVLFACGDEKVELKDFPAEKTENVLLGDFYTVQTSVSDINGNAYRLNATVTDGSNKQVPVVKGEFAITDISGYTVTYTASNVNAKMQVKLAVKDEEKPDIFVLGSPSDINNEVGKQVVLPKINFKDVDSIASSSVKVYLLGTEQTEVTLTKADGRFSFTPSESGAYKIVASATDASGNTVSEERIFQVFEETDFYAPSVEGVNGVKIENAAGGKGYAEKVDIDVTREGNYKGAYISLKSTSTEGMTTLRVNKNEATTAKLHALQDAGYQHVKVWVKAVSENDNAINMRWVATGPDVYPDVPVNAWVQLTLPLKNFVKAYDANVWILLANLNQNGLSELCIGEISASDVLPQNYTLGANQVFAPAESGIGGITIANNKAQGYPTYVAADSTRTGYTDAYISIKSTNNEGVTTFAINKTAEMTARITALKNADNNYVRVWVKVTKSGTTPLRNMWCAGVSPITYADLEANKWVQIDLPMSNFETTYNKAVWMTSANLNQGGVTELCIGNMFAIKNTETVYNPVENGTAGVTVENSNGAAGSATYVAADSARTGYTGAYISLTSTSTSGLTTLRISKLATVTGRITALQTAGCTTVKVWVKIVSTDTSDVSMTWCANGPSLSMSVAVNQWVQVELPLKNFAKTYNDGVWQTFAYLNQNGVTELCIGNIVGVLSK